MPVSGLSVRNANPPTFSRRLFSLGFGEIDDSYSFSSVDTAIDGTCIVVGNWLSETSFMLKLSLYKTVLQFKEYAYAGRLRSVAATKTGAVFMVGETIYYGEGGKDIYLLKTDSEGTLLNYATFGTTGDDYGRSVKSTNDGGCIVIGSKNWLIKTDENGNVE